MRNYDNPTILEFTSTIIETGTDQKGHYVVLENTYFFPEGGGQGGDGGEIDGHTCYEAVEVNKAIRHYVSTEMNIGTKVECKIDELKRFRRMQNHSGEHIVSGIIHNLYGANNVGFHLGDDDVTCDFDIELTKEMIEKVEQFANKIVFSNKNVNVFYPSPEELSVLDYRSKLELTEDVRIVEIEGVDKCACCAPHVSKTGEIGLIKILNPMKWKTGTRVHLKCGYDALYDYGHRYDQSVRVSNLLKVKQEEIFEGVQKLFDDAQEKDYIIGGFKKEKIASIIRDFTPVDKNRVLFYDDIDMDGLTSIVNAAASMTEGYCIALSNTGNGFRFAMKAKDKSVKQCIQSMKQSLNVRGGGTDEYASGNICSEKADIETFFS